MTRSIPLLLCTLLCAALPAMIDGLRERGYGFATVSEMLSAGGAPSPSMEPVAPRTPADRHTS